MPWSMPTVVSQRWKLSANYELFRPGIRKETLKDPKAWTADE